MADGDGYTPYGEYNSRWTAAYLEEILEFHPSWSLEDVFDYRDSISPHYTTSSIHAVEEEYRDAGAFFIDHR